MRRTLLVLITVAGIGALTAGCGGDEPTPTTVTLPSNPSPNEFAPVTIDQSVNGGTVIVTVGQRLHVRLPQTADSTERWAVVNFERGILIPDGGPRADGAATIWPYLAVQPGTTALQYSLTPANKAPIRPAPSFRVDVRVN
ncbi:hypothetical protein ACFXK0_01100 [Nocardia sp. NPDC059177]|uniref:hypothetical protein n=1 Tax=Nocardia sp. NPDC059177 TaxID=3346759 RepID=UPI0036B5D3CF